MDSRVANGESDAASKYALTAATLTAVSIARDSRMVQRAQCAKLAQQNIECQLRQI